jgi:signal peptidase I
MGFRRILRWNERSDFWKTTFSLILVITLILTGYATFAMAMGTSTPLVVVTSGSMETTLYRGDLLVIQVRGEDQIFIDDVIVFEAVWHPETPIVHRVVEIVDDEDIGRKFYTQGDNNPTIDDGFRTIDDIVGVVVGIAPYFGHVSLFLQTDEGKAVAIIVLALVLILPELYDRWKKPTQI